MAYWMIDTPLLSSPSRIHVAAAATALAAWLSAAPAMAAIDVEIAVGPNPARQNETVDLEITVTNSGPSAQDNLLVLFSFPAGFATLSNGLFDGVCPLCCDGACSGGETAEFDIPVLAAGKGVTFSIPARIAAATANGTVIPLQAQVFDDAILQTSDSDTLTVGGARQLELGLIENRDPVAPGDTITYTLTYGALAGSAGAPGATLFLPLPAGTTLVSASDGGFLNGGQVQWNLGGVNPGASGERTAVLQVNAGLATGTILNTEAIFQDNGGNSVIYETATRVQNVIPLELAVVASPDPARPGETLDVEITVSNAGAIDRNGVIVTLEIPDHLATLANALMDGQCTLCCDNACSAQERAFFDVGTVPAGKGVTFSAPFQVLAGTADGTVTTFEASVTDSLGDQRETGASIAVRSVRPVELALTEDRDPARPNGQVTYTATYGLLQTSTAIANATLLLPLPANTTFVSATDGGSLQGNAVVWVIGGVNPGAIGERSATLQVNGAAGAGTRLITEAVLFDNAVPIEQVRYQTVTRVQNEIPLELAITAGPDPARAGEALDVEVTVTNTSAFDRTGIVLTLEVPDHLGTLGNGLFDGDCPLCCDSACSPTERAFFDVGTLGPGQGVNFWVPFRVAAAVTDGTVLTFEAQVDDNQGDQRETGASIALATARQVELALAADRDPVAPGDLIKYTATYGVMIGSTGAANTTLRLPLPPGTTFVSASDGGTLVNNEVRWTIGNLNRGATGERYAVLQVNASVPQGTVINAEAILQDTSSVTKIARYSAASHVEAVNPMEIAVIASPDPAKPGETLDVEVTITNTGAFDRTGVIMRLEYPDDLNVLANGLIDGACSLCCDSACFSQETAVFDVGTIKAGQGVTFSLPMQVTTGVTDGTVLTIDTEVFNNQGDYRTAATNIAVRNTRTMDLALVESAEPIGQNANLVYRITYGAFFDAGGAAGGTLRFAIPPGTTFAKASGGGTQQGDAVVWNIGNTNPGSGGERTVTVHVPAGMPVGSILPALVIFRDFAGNEARFQEATRVQVAPPPLRVDLSASPNPALAGTTINLNLSVTNTGSLAATGVFAFLEYPDGLNTLANSAFGGDCLLCCDNACSARERATFDIGTLAVGQTVNFPVPPVIAAATLNGTVINFDAWVTDNTKFSGSAGRAIKVGSGFAVGFLYGDVNNDERVDVDDLIAVILAWGGCPLAQSNCPPDINADGVVNVDDLIAVILNWTG